MLLSSHRLIHSTWRYFAGGGTHLICGQPPRVHVKLTWGHYGQRPCRRQLNRSVHGSIDGVPLIVVVKRCEISWWCSLPICSIFILPRSTRVSLHCFSAKRCTSSGCICTYKYHHAQNWKSLLAGNLKPSWCSFTSAGHWYPRSFVLLEFGQKVPKKSDGTVNASKKYQNLSGSYQSGATKILQNMMVTAGGIQNRSILGNIPCPNCILQLFIFMIVPLYPTNKAIYRLLSH